MKKQNSFLNFLILILPCILIQCSQPNLPERSRFTENWKFHLGDANGFQHPDLDDSQWRSLNLPHDWSIEGEFSKDHPATPGGGALPGGIGWYRKSFTLDESEKDQLIFIDFDGLYCNGEVWINGEYLGKRPYGYSSFRYELTPYLNYGDEMNVLAVKVDNSQQPNSRWYSGSGIYRNVWLVKTNKVHVAHWGVFITTPEVSSDKASISVKTDIKNENENPVELSIENSIVNPDGEKLETIKDSHSLTNGESANFSQNLQVDNPALWSVDQPNIYKMVTRVLSDGKVVDEVETNFGIRSFEFDPEKGFILNGEQVKILGVCNHHDLGCLGATVNTRAIERQLEILKEMGCNGIRTAHNPPAPELLDLCDRMGFIVMDEAFDVWKVKKTEYDYHMHFDAWHQRDLQDLIKRDRNHPSVFMWSIGNEVMEQWDGTGGPIAHHLVKLVKEVDDTRPVISGCNDPKPTNPLNGSGALDIIGMNYFEETYPDIPSIFPGQPFVATETNSALATRGEYDMPSDLIRRWPVRGDYKGPGVNEDYTCSAYDNCTAPWGATHEENWKIVRAHDHIAGMFLWTGFDYIGEPTPYWWPPRSSYFGIIDLAGFPKDAFYMYQSEWTDKEVLHIFPHWNWNEGDTADIWAYSSEDEVELFLNDQSLGIKKKEKDDIHLMWRVPYVPGTIKAVAMKDGEPKITRIIKTAGEPEHIRLTPDRSSIKADGADLSFITVDLLDADGNIVPHADNLIHFEIKGNALIAGVDNGNPLSHEPFKANYRKAFNGKCLVLVQAGKEAGNVVLSATSEGLKSAETHIALTKDK